MPFDTWAQPPTITPRWDGFYIPVQVAQTGDGSEFDPIHYQGVGLQVRSLTAVDIRAAITADPDANQECIEEALGLALGQTASGVQNQMDQMMDAVLEMF